MARFSVDHEVGSSSGAQAHEPAPDSSELRVSRNVKHESGIPPAREGRTRDRSSAEADLRLEQALSDVARTEANLQSLVRGLKHLTAGASAALDSTRPLVSEIDAIRGLLSQASEAARPREQTEAQLRERVLELTMALEKSRVDARRDMERFVEQEDLFLIELLNDHEGRVRELEHRLADLAKQSGGPEVAELILQRDQARAYALQCEFERDLAWRDLGVQTPAPRVGSSFPPPSDSARGAAIGSVRFRVNTPPPEPHAQTPTPPTAEVSPKPVARRSAEYSLVGGEAVEKPTSTQRLPVR